MDVTLSQDSFDRYKSELESEIETNLHGLIKDYVVMAFTTGFDARMLAAFKIDMQSLTVKALKRVTKELEDGPSES
jgi:hypothetical protein